MAVVTVHSDFGAQENKIRHCFHFSPIYLPWSDGTGHHDLSLFNVEFQVSLKQQGIVRTAKQEAAWKHCKDKQDSRAVWVLLGSTHEMAGWHHWLDGRESEWTPGAGDGQGGLACCGSWGRRVGRGWAAGLHWRGIRSDKQRLLFRMGHWGKDYPKR